jgi:hypothetical protein
MLATNRKGIEVLSRAFCFALRLSQSTFDHNAAFPLRVKMAHYNMQSTYLVVYSQHLSPQIAQLDSAENVHGEFISLGEHHNNIHSPRRRWKNYFTASINFLWYRSARCTMAHNLLKLPL